MVTSQGLVESIITLKKEKFPGYFSFWQLLCTSLRKPSSVPKSKTRAAEED